MHLLHAKVCQQSQVPPTEWEHFCSLIKLTKFKVGDTYPKNCVGFIQKGLFRAYYLQENGEDLHREFAFENDFICYLTLYQTSETEDLVIEALEESEVYCMTQAQLDQLYTRHVCWADFGRKIMEEALLKKMRRERQLLGDSLEVRYKQFKTDYGHLETRVPQHMIASFLGVSPVSLSRLRSSLRSELVV